MYHGFRCQDVQLLQRCLTMVEAELDKSPYWNAKQHVSDFDVHDSDQLTKSNHGLLVLLYASLLHHLSRPVTAARHLKFILDNKSELMDDFYIVPFAQFELATIHLEQLQHTVHSSSSSSSTAATSSHSDDNQLRVEGESDESSTAPSPTADQVREEYRLAAGYKEKYHFKNRLHLRIHLAVTELKRLGKGDEGEGGGDDTEGEDALSDEDRKLVELARKTEEAEKTKELTA